MRKFKAPIKVKSETEVKHNEMLETFQEMMDSWKYKREGRDYSLVDNKEELTVEILAWKE